MFIWCIIIYYDSDSYTGYSISGPKGVINDWRKYKQLEVEQKQEQKKEMERLIKKLSMTCRSDLDLEKDQEKQKEMKEKLKSKVSSITCLKKMLVKLNFFVVHGRVPLETVPRLIMEHLLWEKAENRQRDN